MLCIIPNHIPTSLWFCFIFYILQAFFLSLYIAVNIFLLFGSERDFSLSVNQMLSVAHKETVYHVCLLREHRWGFTVRPGSSSVCQTLRGICLSLLGHQMGGVYGIRQYYKWQDVHTFTRKYLKVSLVVGFLIDSSPEPHTSGEADRTKAVFLCISWEIRLFKMRKIIIFSSHHDTLLFNFVLFAQKCGSRFSDINILEQIWTTDCRFGFTNISQRQKYSDWLRTSLGRATTLKN